MERRSLGRIAAACLPAITLGVLLAVTLAAGVTEPALAVAPPTPVPTTVPRSVVMFPDPIDRKPVRSQPSIPPDALCPEWWGTAWGLGWGQEELLRLDVVMHRESRCIPDVWNRRDPNGGSRGLLQVNGSWTRWLREKGVLEEKEDLFDPEVNLAAALAIYRYGLDRYEFGWGPWGFRYVDPYTG